MVASSGASDNPIADALVTGEGRGLDGLVLKVRIGLEIGGRGIIDAQLVEHHRINGKLDKGAPLVVLPDDVAGIEDLVHDVPGLDEELQHCSLPQAQKRRCLVLHERAFVIRMIHLRLIATNA